MKITFAKFVATIMAVTLVGACAFLTGCANPNADMGREPITSASEPAHTPVLEAQLEEVEDPETDFESKDAAASVEMENGSDEPSFDEGSNIVEASDEELAPEEEEWAEEKSEFEANPEEGERDYEVHVNLASGGGEIPLNEDGVYVGNSGEDYVPSPPREFDSFEEIDTSTLSLMETVTINDRTYVWFGPEMGGTVHGGFFEYTGDNGGQHIVADFELTGNIIGY